MAEPAPGPQPPNLKPLRLGRVGPASPEPVLDGDTRQGERFRGTDFGEHDLSFATFSECELLRCRVSDADLTGVHLRDVAAADLDAAVLRAPRSEWRTVELGRSRLGSVELYESVWRSVLISDTKLGYVNARGAHWQDVLARACTFDELDLAGATVSRLRFEDCRVESLQLHGATLADVDLRGAELHVLEGLAGLRGCTVSSYQLELLAPLLAAHLGLQVADGN
jgi:uncharacterized protein YjbI with pentapeptide repeats